VLAGGAVQVELRSVDALAPYAGNARTHPDWQIAELEFGYPVQEVTVRSDCSAAG